MRGASHAFDDDLCAVDSSNVMVRNAIGVVFAFLVQVPKKAGKRRESMTRRPLPTPLGTQKCRVF